jgi:N-methylhydantoinase A
MGDSADVNNRAGTSEKTDTASVAVDIGGTFTDIVLVRGDNIWVDKTLSTPDDLIRGVINGIRSILLMSELAPADINGRFVHATTVVTNALIERRGARAAMLFTEGFADILRLRNEHRYDIYDTQIEFPEPIVNETFTIKERVTADGSVLTSVCDADVAELADRLRENRIESLGVCFLHSYRNPDNEQAVVEKLSKLLQGLTISISSDVAPQIREYARASTTAINAYAMPITGPYLKSLRENIVSEGVEADPLIVLSSGGVVPAATAGKYPVRMIESGPAAGALAAAHIAEVLNEPRLLAFDMGGTTAKVCLIQDFIPLVASQFEVDRMYRLKDGSGFPVCVPTIDLIEIGAGGGSIAEIGSLGLLKVGPRSAGAEPGPACYMRGGKEATVTDACVALGLLDPANFLGGEMPLNAEASDKALADLGDKIDLNGLDVARGIFRIVCEAMASAVRAHAADRGVDYRQIPLLAFGGSGPVHACEVAIQLGSQRVVFPPAASVFSAFGAVVAPLRIDLVRSGLQSLKDLDWSSVSPQLDELAEEGIEALLQARIAREDIELKYSVDMRYCGQHHEVTVNLVARPDQDTGLRDAFESEYLKRYSVIQPDIEVEIVNWRLAAISPSGVSPHFGHSPGEVSFSRTRTVYAWGDAVDVPVIKRHDLGEQSHIRGPLIIEERETTLVIGDGWMVSAGPEGCIIADRVEG